MPLSDLVLVFPENDDERYLAYAESASFMHYLQQNFGSDHLESLLKEYSTGTGYEQGFYNVYQGTAGQMKTTWKQSLSGEQPAYFALVELLSYLLVLLMIVGVPL